MNNTKRIELIDIAKAIAIFFVLMGHTTGNLDTPLFRRVIYSFHMPLFFILSGISINPRLIGTWDEWKVFIKKNLLSLMVPFLIWGLIYGTFSFKAIGKLLYGSWEYLVGIGTLSSLWFLPCLFVARIFVQIIVNCICKAGVTNSKICYLAAGVVMAVVGFYLPHPLHGTVWCADVAVLASGFILFGMAIKDIYLDLGKQKKWMPILVFVVSLVAFFCSTFGRGDALDLSLICAGNNGNMFWFFAAAILGGMVVLSLSWLVCRISKESKLCMVPNVIRFVGSHTMGIFLLHKPFLWEVVVPSVQTQLSGCYMELVAIVSTVIAMIYSILMCLVINKYLPQLFGKF